MNNPKQNIIDHLELLTPEQLEFLAKLIQQLPDKLGKGDLINLAYTEEESRKVDSAYPQPYADAIREILPNWKGHFHVYDYNENKFGQMTNVAEKFVEKLNSLF